MLLRFQKTDFLSAAGSAAKVPSRIGSEQAAIIGHTHPNGTLYTETPEVSSRKPSVTAAAKENMADNSTVAYYNAGSAFVVLLLLGAVGAIFYTLRKKVRQSQDKQGELGRYEAAYTPPATPYSSEKSRRMAQHKRGLSTTSRASSQAGEDAHELERLVKNDGQGYHGASQTSVIPEEEVFSLGDSDEEDSEKRNGQHH